MTFSRPGRLRTLVVCSLAFCATALYAQQVPSPNPFQDLPPAPAPKAAPAVAPQDAIEDLVFVNVRRTPLDLLRNLIVSRQGAKYDKEALDRDAVALRNTMRFNDISWGAERGKTGWIVTFHVEERPVDRAANADGVQSVAKSEILDRFRERAK